MNFTILSSNKNVFFDLRLNKRLSKQSRRRWFETPLRLLWRHCNGGVTSSETKIPVSFARCLPSYFPRLVERVECCSREDGYYCKPIDGILVDIWVSVAGRNNWGRHGWYLYRLLIILSQQSLMKQIHWVSIGSHDGLSPYSQFIFNRTMMSKLQ